MIVKRNHPFVSPGFVSIPYLLNWIYPSSNLVNLVHNLSDYFSNDPPLFARPNPNPIFNSNHSFSASGSGTVAPTIPPRSYPPSPSPPPPQRIEDSAEVYRRNAVSKLVENVHSDVFRLRKDREVEMEGIFSAQSVLRLREQEVENGLRKMRDEKEGLEHQLQMVLLNIDVLEGWVRENKGKLGGEIVNVDEAILPADSLSKQLLECTPSDLSIDNVVYVLDKAVQNGCIPIDLYLRNVRLLSREQFIHRATCVKVRAIQMQDQVTRMASRLSSDGV